MKEAVRKFKETIEIKSSVLNRLRSHRYFSITLLVGAILLACCFHVWQRVRVIRLVQETSRLRTEKKSINDNYKKVCSDIAALSMSARIENYAQDTLGMIPVEADHLYTLIKNEKEPVLNDNELMVMFSAVKRIARYMPVVVESKASAGEAPAIRFDSANAGVIGE